MLRPIDNGLEVLRTEVADSDTLELPFIFQVLENLPQGLQLPRRSDERVVNQKAVGDEAEPV